jgi:hypothetical protein
MTRFRSLLPLAILLLIAGCAVTPPTPELLAPPRPGAVLGALSLDRATEDRILAIDPLHVSGADLQGPLSKAPAPHIVLLHGGVYPVHLLMENFARFLMGMGYPEAAIRDPGDRSLSRSPYEDSARQAGLIAWYYEREGMRPMMVGHSQGGIQAVKILHELAGNLDTPLHPFNPYANAFDHRTTIVDPLSGRERPVLGLSVSYTAVVGTGGVSLALPMHWNIISRIRTIPDTVEEFTGYRIGLDLFAWDIPGFENIKTFSAIGKAEVHNVTLPAEYSHVFVPVTSSFASDPVLHPWLDAFDPANPASEVPPTNAQNLLFAADVWYSIKKHWVLELQRLIRARRGAAAPTSPAGAVEKRAAQDTARPADGAH